jgi:ribosomal protein S18 acetylase RimI-like enzyme
MTPQSPSNFKIRPYALGDEEGVYNVCLKTGNAGSDATHLYQDPKALGHLYIGPYMKLEPQLAFVLTDDEGVCGYVLGARDSAEFYHRYRTNWLPEIRKDYVRPTAPKEQWTETDKVVEEFFLADVYMPQQIGRFAAHMHIDLLPRAQGCGWGRQMVETLLEKMRSLAVTGVHLGVAAENLRAQGFYRKLGFEFIDQHTSTLYMGKIL